MSTTDAVMAVVDVTAPPDVDPCTIEAELTRAISDHRKLAMTAEVTRADEVRPQPGVVSHAGARLLADLAASTTLTGARRSTGCAGRGHDMIRDRVLVDLAVAMSAGAEATSDTAILTDQETLIGPVASDSTSVLLEALDQAALAAIAAARTRAGDGVGAAGRGHQGTAARWRTSDDDSSSAPSASVPHTGAEVRSRVRDERHENEPDTRR